MWSYLSAKVETRAFSIDIIFKDEGRSRGTGDFNKPMSRHELMVVFFKGFEQECELCISILQKSWDRRN